MGLAENIDKDAVTAITGTNCEPMNMTAANHEDGIDMNNDACKEMFVDAPSDLPPVTITDLDCCDHEVEINVDDPTECDEGMIVDTTEDNPAEVAPNGQMATDEQTEKSDNNNLAAAQQNSMIGAIFF